MKVCCIGDPHLGKNGSLSKPTLGSSLNSREIDQSQLLDWILNYAIENEIEHIAFTGDVFEEAKPPPQLITLLMSWLQKCKAHNIFVHIVRGNHDIMRIGMNYVSPLDIISKAEYHNVSVYNDIQTIFIDQTAFTFMPFRDRKSFAVSSNAEAMTLLRQNLVYDTASIPLNYHKVLIGHFAIEGSIPVGDEIDDLTNELFCPIEMFNDYDYVWMGHVHKPQVMHPSNPYVAHIGSMDISNFGETEQKKIAIIFDCQSGEWDTQVLPTRPLKKISITIPKDTEDTTQYVLDQIHNEKLDRAIVKLDIILASPEMKSINRSVIEKALTDQGAFNITGVSESKKSVLIKKDNNNILDSKMDVVRAIKTYSDLYIEEKRRDNFINISMELYNNFKAESKE